jgi:hypothetical protein
VPSRRKKSAGTTRPPRRRKGLPPPESVVAEDELVSPKGTRYRVLTTTEKDAYENGEPGRKR